MERKELAALLVPLLCVVLFIVVPCSIMTWKNESSSNTITIQITGEVKTLVPFSFPSSKFPSLCPSPILIQNRNHPYLWFNDYEDDKAVIEIPPHEEMLNLTYRCNCSYAIVIVNLIPIFPRQHVTSLNKSEPKSFDYLEILLWCFFFLLFLSIPSIFIYDAINTRLEFNNREKSINK